MVRGSGIVHIGWKARSGADPSVASFRYRVLKPVEVLSRRGHAIELFDERHLASYDKVVFSKAYGSEDQALARRLRKEGREVILDLCDNHFYNPYGLTVYERARSDLLTMLPLASTVVCSTPALAREVRREAALTSLPTIVGDMFEDAGIQRTPPHRQSNFKPRLLWFGLHGSPNAPSGMEDVQCIAGELERQSRSTPFDLVVVSNSREKFEKIVAPLPFASRYVEWTPAAFADELSKAHAVVLPLSANPFVACKTHNRLSLSLAAGVPVVADIIESYREFAPFCYLSCWSDGLGAVLRDSQSARARAARARSYLETHWGASAVAIQWERALGILPLGKTTKLQEHDRAHGELRLAPTGVLLGWAHDPRSPKRVREVQLIVNGEIRATTPADLPAVSREHHLRRLERSRGGFIFSSNVHSYVRDPLMRCTIRFADSHEPVFNTMLDLYDS